ncbi:hypothetical protein [Streptomyces sp. NPDC000931]|uniref:Uncharacterized protein n=1 Tax=Nocardiopsis eucommiae TaxID=2831970 RepID=A0A975L7U8_9ACTN|nr:hypothetical protein KGD82_15830 [Nocardiopsis eucommiae]
MGRHGNLIESGAYWLLYVVSFSGALLHWRLGNELLAAICAVTAVFSVLLIGRVRILAAPQER